MHEFDRTCRSVASHGRAGRGRVRPGLPGPGARPAHAPRGPAPRSGRRLAESPGGIANFAVALARLGLRTGMAATFGADDLGDRLWDQLEPGRAHRPDSLPQARRLADARSRWRLPMTTIVHWSPAAALRHWRRRPDHHAPDRPSRRRPHRSLAERVARQGQGHRQPGLRRRRLGPLRAVGPRSPRPARALRRLPAERRRSDEPTPVRRRLRQRSRQLADEGPGGRRLQRRPRGPRASTAGTGERIAVPAYAVPAADTTGAGDVFAAGFIAATLWDLPLDQRVRFAALTAALSVTKLGGADAAPTWADLARWQHGRPPGRPAPPDALISAHSGR